MYVADFEGISSCLHHLQNASLLPQAIKTCTRQCEKKTVRHCIILTPPKTNMDTQNDGLEKVTPFKHGNFWYLYHRIPHKMKRPSLSISTIINNHFKQLR